MQVLADAQVAVERELLRHVAEPGAGGAGGAIEVEAGDAGPAGGRPQEAAHHLERGRFAGAVGAEQAEDLAAADAEGDVVGRGEVAELLGQPVGLDHGCGVVVASRGCAVRARLGRRLGRGPAAHQVDEGILEARRCRADRGAVVAELGGLGAVSPRRRAAGERCCPG